MQLRLSVCLTVNVVYMYWSDISVTDTNVRCRYFMSITMFILSSHCCLFDAVLQYPHVAGNRLNGHLLLGGMQRSGRGCCANYH